MTFKESLLLATEHLWQPQKIIVMHTNISQYAYTSICKFQQSWFSIFLQHLFFPDWKNLPIYSKKPNHKSETFTRLLDRSHETDNFLQSLQVLHLWEDLNKNPEDQHGALTKPHSTNILHIKINLNNRILRTTKAKVQGTKFFLHNLCDYVCIILTIKNKQSKLKWVLNL